MLFHSAACIIGAVILSRRAKSDPDQPFDHHRGIGHRSTTVCVVQLDNDRRPHARCLRS